MPCIEYYLERGIPLEEARRRVEEDVFGVRFRRDRQGRPIENDYRAPKKRRQRNGRSRSRQGRRQERLTCSIH
jgi:hypothetical protein